MEAYATPAATPGPAPSGLVREFSMTSNSSRRARQRPSLKGGISSFHKRASSIITSSQQPRIGKACDRDSPAPIRGAHLSFHIYSTTPLYQRRSNHKGKSYSLSRQGTGKPDYVLAAPQNGFGTHRPDMLVQRNSAAGPVVGEIRFRGMMKATRIVLPGRTPGAMAESTAFSADRFRSGKNKVAFMGRDWYWKSVVGERPKSSLASIESTERSWRCEDAAGNLYALLIQARRDEEVGSLTILLDELGAGEVEGLVVTAMAMFAGEERRGGRGGED